VRRHLPACPGHYNIERYQPRRTIRTRCQPDARPRQPRLARSCLSLAKLPYKDALDGISYTVSVAPQEAVLYGADPKLFSDVVKKEFLPEDRAVGCRDEYAQLSHAFESLIGPHIDRGLARKLHKRWLPPVTAQPKTWRGADRGRP